MPLGYETSSIVIPHAETKYTHRSPADGPSFIDVGSPNTFTPLRRRCATAASRSGDVEADVVAAHVAVLWNCFVLILDVIFKQFDRRTVRTFQHPQLVYL
jgi:hypothetical protein